jgi:hypothetical protein
MAAKLLGCDVVKIGVFNEEGREDPYTEDDDEKKFTLEDLENKLPDVQVDPQGAFISYTHDWNHDKEVQMFLGLYPEFEGKADLFYNRMGTLQMPEHTNEFEFDTDNFVLDEDPIELTKYIWGEIKSHTTEEQLSDLGYGGDDRLGFSEVSSWLDSTVRAYDVLKDLHKYINTMLNSVFVYTFYENNWKYFEEGLDKEYRVVLDDKIMKIYSLAGYYWQDGIRSGKELLSENDIQISSEDPYFAESRGYYLLKLEDIKKYLNLYPRK